MNVLFDFKDFPIDTDNSYFAGWNIYNDYVSHSGKNPNYSSQVYVDRYEPLGVFALAAKHCSSADIIADGLFRMYKGETVRIGLQIDLIEVLDIIFVLIPLLIIYFVLWIPINTKVKAVVRLVIGSVCNWIYNIFVCIAY